MIETQVRRISIVPNRCLNRNYHQANRLPEQCHRKLQKRNGRIIRGYKTRCLKHQAALSVAYGAGLRVAEVSALKVSNIDSKRMLLRVECGKGGRDRNAMLPEGLLLLLRDWWRAGRQQGILYRDGWLFPGQGAAAHISTRQLHRVVVEAAEAADIDKRVGPHTLRHSFATHLLEDGVNIRVIQALLGHANLNTTAFYLQVATKTTRKVTSPLDRLALASPIEEPPDG